MDDFNWDRPTLGPEQLEDEKKKLIYQTLAKKFADRSAIEGAQSNASQANNVADWGQIAEGLVKSRSMALGGPGVDTGFYDGLRKEGQDKVKSATDARREAIKTYLVDKNNADKMEQTNFDRDRQASESRARQDLAADNQDWRQSQSEKNDDRWQQSFDQRNEQIKATREATSENKAYNRNQKENALGIKADKLAGETAIPGTGVALDKKAAQEVRELESRKDNVSANLKILRNRIEKFGTGTTFDSLDNENDVLSQLIDDMATDMAKIKDPSSVARPSEVEAIKENLFKPGFWQTEDSALENLKVFEGLVNRTYENSRKLRLRSGDSMEPVPMPNKPKPAWAK